MLTKRSDNFSKWYNELVSKAQLAENGQSISEAVEKVTNFLQTGSFM